MSNWDSDFEDQLYEQKACSWIRAGNHNIKQEKKQRLAHKASKEKPFCASCLGEHKEMTPAYFASPIVTSSWSIPPLASQGQEAVGEHVSNVSIARSLGCVETQLPQNSCLRGAVLLMTAKSAHSTTPSPHFGPHWMHLQSRE